MYQIAMIIAYIWLGPAGVSPVLNPKKPPQFNSLQDCLQNLPWIVHDIQESTAKSARSQGFELQGLHVRAKCVPVGGTDV